MARGHIRHFAGNRDDVLTAAAILLYFGVVPDADVDSPVPTPRSSFLTAGTTTVPGALDYLFGEFAQPGAENMVVLAFVEAARTNPRINAIVLQAYTGFQEELATVLTNTYPDAPSQSCARVAYGIFTIAVGNLFMADIAEDPRRTTAAREAAEQLVATLR